MPILPIGRGEGTPGAHGIGVSPLPLPGQVCAEAASKGDEGFIPQ